MARIGIYGGTFNPIHRGHIEAAKQAVQLLKLDKLLMIPAATPPHKTLPEGSASPLQRLEMVKLSVGQEDAFKVSDIELNREGRSYTADTVEQLHKLYPKDHLYLLMGTDMFYSFLHWYQPERICRFATLGVMLREDERHTNRGLLEKTAEDVRRELGGRVRFVNNKALPMSSTDVRRMIIFQAAEEMLPSGVWDKIQQWKLYGAAECLEDLPMDKLEATVCKLLDHRRISHVLGCRDTAVLLAEKYGVDTEVVSRSALLHDITKALPFSQQEMLLHSFGVLPEDYREETPNTIHAFTGSLVAKRIFGENDDVCRAIASHTTGCTGMDTLQKIIYIADYIEPNRDFPGAETLRKLTLEDLDTGVLQGLQMTAELVKNRGHIMAKATQDAISYMSALCNKKTLEKEK